MNPLTHIRALTLPLVIVVAFACFGLSYMVQAVSPPPDGGYGGNNTAEGTNALFNLTTGVWNVAVGFEALKNDTTGDQNTATGYRALFSNTTGDKSTAYGSQALFSNTTGNDNVATGFGTLYTNTTGNRNTGMGYRTLTFNNGDDNTAVGWNALYNNRTANQNTADGFQALFSNTTGGGNTAVGGRALIANTTGELNTATGVGALSSNTTGFGNTAIGNAALDSNTTGSGNTVVGSFALDTEQIGQRNTAIGDSALARLEAPGTSDNIALGYFSGGNMLDGTNDIVIGSLGACCDQNTIRIGNQVTATDIIGILHPRHEATYIAGISGAGVSGMPVVVSADGQLGIAPSSARFKDEIKPMDKASEALYALKPVTFRYKKAIDPVGASQFGLVAEDVERVNADLVVRDKEGKPYTVHYDQVNAMMLNEFLKEHSKVEEQDCKLQAQGAAITELKKQVAALNAGLQKVSAQLELSKAAPQTVLNNP